MGRMVALLRAVNVGGRKLPMAELRELCEGLGWSEVATYVQSGNVVFTGAGKPAALERVLEKAIEQRFGFKAPAMIRTGRQLAGYARDNPFAAEARDTPNLLLLYVSKERPAAGAEAAIQKRAADGEMVKRAGNALWIHYPDGSGRSRLSPSLIDKAIGSPATSRNWRTLMALKEMLEA